MQKGKAIRKGPDRQTTPSKKRFHLYVDPCYNGSQSKKPSLSSPGLDGSTTPFRSLAGLVISNKPSIVFHMETKLRGHEWDYIKNQKKLTQALVAEDSGIFDVGFSGFPYTWFNNFTSLHSTKARLDRGLASKDWIEEFPDNSRLGLLEWKRDVLGNVQHKIESKQAPQDSLNQGTITNVSKEQALTLAKEIDKLHEANDVY
ncbi:hypothetical protein LIER_08090 [Lithospermum erythrorhizon]|uniref:Uncharacterized protein n=1 Tax=Lithospermum erythrorhizon TaxID=34254 RepID=A0AAV3PCF1_LITER